MRSQTDKPPTVRLSHGSVPVPRAHNCNRKSGTGTELESDIYGNGNGNNNGNSNGGVDTSTTQKKKGRAVKPSKYLTTECAHQLTSHPQRSQFMGQSRGPQSATARLGLSMSIATVTAMAMATVMVTLLPAPPRRKRERLSIHVSTSLSNALTDWQITHRETHSASSEAPTQAQDWDGHRLGIWCQWWHHAHPEEGGQRQSKGARPAWGS